MDRKRRLLWKRLVKAKSRIQQAKTISQVMKFMQDKADLEEELKQDYDAVNNIAEDQEKIIQRHSFPLPNPGKRHRQE